MIKPLLELQNLTVNAGRSDKAKIILDNISFSLAPREIVGVVGASGAGKTVLSKAVVNWLEPPLSVRSGSVLFEGKDIYGISENEMRTLRRRVAYVGANPMVHSIRHCRSASRSSRSCVRSFQNLAERGGKAHDRASGGRPHSLGPQPFQRLPFAVFRRHDAARTDR